MKVFFVTLLLLAGDCSFGSDQLPPLDPDYLEILNQLERQKNLQLFTHHDTQWKAVAQTMLELPVDDRVELLDTVKRYPLFRSLPPTVAISPRTLGHRNIARSVFLEMVRRRLR